MKNKIITYSNLSLISKKLKEKGKKIILVTGVFDLLHYGHLNFLKKAKAVGDYLFVGIETDYRVKQLKGIDRPIENQETRLKKISNVNSVDYGFLLPENFSKTEDHDHLIKLLKPDIIAVSSHSPFINKKQEIINKYNGQLLIVENQDKSISTTKIINNLSKK